MTLRAKSKYRKTTALERLIVTAADAPDFQPGAGEKWSVKAKEILGDFEINNEPGTVD